MESVIGFRVLPFFVSNSENKYGSRVQVRSLGDADAKVLSSDSVVVNGTSIGGERGKGGTSIGQGNGHLRSKVEEKRRVKDEALETLKPLWNDGYGTETVRDFFDMAKDIVKHDGGPPRWFCPVSCGRPLKDSPTLLFLPGMDGTGLGLVLHHKALGKAFEIWCLHIPVHDRTPFEGLVKLVEETVRFEHALSPHKPIYLVGDSFGGCLALAVASHNPAIDLVLILSNPATSFGRSQLQPLFPILEAMPDGLHSAVPYLLSSIMGDPVKMAAVNIESNFPPGQRFERLSHSLTGLLPYLSGFDDIIPRDTLLWKLKLLKSAAAYANSRLHAVKAEVLVLASGKDNMLPSRDEAERLKNSLQDCVVRHFKDNGHTLLLEDGIGLLTVIKGTSKFRRSRRHSYASDFLPPSMTELNYACDQIIRLLRLASGSILFSTLEDGKRVKGLSGVPIEGPVILVGYHMLMGVELSLLAEGFLREKNIMVCGLAHPMLFSRTAESSSSDFSLSDWMSVFGAVPVTPSDLFRLLSTKSLVLLYPGGSREALHYKGAYDGNKIFNFARLLRAATDPILFSTLEDGKITKGFAGVPSEGPVLLVGNHMFMGLELPSLAEGFLREKNIMIRGLAHPMLFLRSSSSEFSTTDWVKVFGAVPVTGSNFFKLLSTKSHVLLYPGGSREALHYKGEEYKLFWPDQQEFVRMAARFGATIVPFGAVGEDDVAEMLLDYNDLIKIPVVNDLIREAISRNTLKVRDETKGEVANRNLFFPLMVPKIPGRFYYLFGKPIKTKGREDILKDKQVANQLYLRIKAEVERNMAFLIEKREEDPFRNIVDRTLYKAMYTPAEVPAFET